MEVNPYGSGGPVWYRIRLGTRVGSKVAAWIQRRRWYFWWRDWAPMSNARVTVGNRILDQYNALESLISEYEAIATHETEAIKFVEQTFGDDGISKPFRGPKRPKETRLPDNADEVSKVIKAFKEGKDGGRKRMFYNPQRLERKAAPGGKQTGPLGERSVYTEKELNDFTQALSRSYVASEADNKIPFKGLHDQPKPPQGDKGKQNQASQKQQQQNQNNRPDGD